MVVVGELMKISFITVYHLLFTTILSLFLLKARRRAWRSLRPYQKVEQRRIPQIHTAPAGERTKAAFAEALRASLTSFFVAFDHSKKLSLRAGFSETRTSVTVTDKGAEWPSSS